MPFKKKHETAKEAAGFNREAEQIAESEDVQIDSLFDGDTKDDLPPPRPTTGTLPPPLPPLPAPPLSLGYDAGYVTAVTDASNLVGKIEKKLRAGAGIHLEDVRALRKAIDGLRPA